jgi:two-component system response regulator YesN
MPLKHFEILPEIKQIGVSVFDPVWALSEHYSNGTELLYILRGEVELISGDNSFKGSEGDLIIIAPGTLHRDYFNLEKGFEVFSIFFSWTEEASKNFHKSVNNQNLNLLNNASKSEIKKQLEIFRGVSGGSDLDELLVRSKLLTLLLFIYRSVSSKYNTSDDSSNRSRKLMLQAKEYLEKNYHKIICLEDIAQELNVSPFHLSHVFSQESSFSLFSYLMDLRMQKAKQLLLEGKLIIADIAYRVGYSDSNYFSKVFRRYYGKSPSEFSTNPQ